MPESGGTGPNGIALIDTSTLTRPRAGRAARGYVFAKQIGLVLAAGAGCLLWSLLVLSIVIPLSENASAEAVIAIAGLIIAGAPAIGLILYLVRFRHQHFAGVGGMISTDDFGPEELGRTVPHLGVALRTVIDGITAYARGLGPAAGRADTDPAKRRMARNLKLGLAGAVVFALVLYVVTESLVAVLPLLVGVAGYQTVLRKSRQAVQPTLEAVRAADARKPVLLLRSFDDDAIEMTHRFRSRIGDVEQTRRFEQQFTGMFEAFGPLIAIGRPGEDLPQIGAARGYRSEGEWQTSVIRWIDEAVFIAMIAGPTDWVRWELDRILEMGRLRHLLILLPPTKEKLALRWSNVLGALATTRWHPALAALETRGLLLVLLRPDGTVLAIRREGKAQPFADDYQVAIAIALYEMLCRTPAGATGATGTH